VYKQGLNLYIQFKS